MGISIESSSSPDSLLKGSETIVVSPNIISPSSDKRYWSTLRSRVDNLLEHKKPIDSTQNGGLTTEGSKRLKEDSMLLLKGFDSVAQTLSLLSNNLENALQGARDLARPPTMTEILQCTLERAKNEEPSMKREDEQDAEAEDEEGKRGQKRKFDPQESPEDQAGDPKKEHLKSPNEHGKLNRAKNLAISMATKAAAMARELKSIKSDLCFMQERCSLLEEENKKLREGFSKGIRPEEDDLVRLQLEVLLAEKSRLASENANLTRENRCLNQLVEYHQLTSQDLSASYENLITGMCLDFSSPTTSVPEYDEEHKKNGSDEDPQTPRAENLQFCKSLDECYKEQ